MNKLFFSVVSLLAFTSCASEYKIEGSSSVSRLDGKMLFVKVPSGDRMLSIDSAEVIHGMFKMEGITDSTSMASLYMDDESIMPFVIEKEHKLYYYRGLSEFKQASGFLVGTMQSAQDVYEAWIRYFNEELLEGLKI